jgi:transposase
MIQLRQVMKVIWKGQKYATIVYNLERSCVVWIGQGKARETIDRFFKEKLSGYQRKQIVSGCCDMSETLYWSYREIVSQRHLDLGSIPYRKSLE